MKIHAGSCHCGGVRFSVRWDLTELTTCDCSLCVKRNALMAKVPEEALTVTQGEELLTLYEWNTRRAKHYFCRICGLYVFHRKRAAPDHFGVNIFCLDDFDSSALPVRATSAKRFSHFFSPILTWNVMQGTRPKVGCSSRVSPTRQISPIWVAFRSRPSVVMFSPNHPLARGRPSDAAHQS